MNKTTLLRIDQLEQEIKAQAAAPLWVDMIDNRVRVDVGKKRGEELTFESVCKCAAFVEEKLRKAETVHGLACISNVADLFEDVPFTYTEDATDTGVLMNLGAWRGDPLADLALASWKHSHGLIDSHGRTITRGKAENLPPPSENSPQDAPGRLPPGGVD